MRHDYLYASFLFILKHNVVKLQSLKNVFNIQLNIRILLGRILCTNE